LRDEIVSRYYYQKGRIIANLKDDPQLNKAVELLKEPSTISSILHGTYEFGDIKLALDR
jgi:carboxyl-terminal processing protease